MAVDTVCNVSAKLKIKKMFQGQSFLQTRLLFRKAECFHVRTLKTMTLQTGRTNFRKVAWMTVTKGAKIKNLLGSVSVN